MDRPKRRFRSAQFPPGQSAVGTSAWRGAAAYGALIAVMVGPFLRSPAFFPAPGSGPVLPKPAVRHAHTTAATFHRIVLPDLVVIDPGGLTAAAIAKLNALPGLRASLVVDGATLSLGGRKVNVLGVNPEQFRSWTSLRTASNARLWSSLSSGGFVTTPALRHKLRLHEGQSYPVTGTGTMGLTFAGAAPLGVSGIDMIVSNRVSGQLGLVHQVAALLSAPGTAMGRLEREVRAAAGPAATLVPLRAQPLPVDPAKMSRPASYVQLFQASAAQFCPGLSWTVLAAIGQIESGDGANVGPSPAGALGPMQFMPSTWARWGITAFGETGPPNIMDPYDAVPSAARYLCAAGGSTPAGLPGAIFAYNHANWYVAEVLALARSYAQMYG